MNRQQWQPLALLTRQIPEALMSWMACQTSLTEQLQQYTGQPVVVEVLSEHQCRLGEDAALIGQQPQSIGRCRQIYLRTGEQRWIAASTLIPESVWQQQALQQLGTQPIGSLLFDNPSNSQREIEACYVATLPTEFSGWAQPCVWGRRSVFQLNQSPILIYEFFSERLYG